MREGEKKEREKKKERKEKKKELTGSTATHEGVVTEGAPESSSGTMTGPPTSRRKTATEELAVPRSKPTERGSSGGEEEEEGVEEEATATTTRGGRRRRMLLNRLAGADAAVAVAARAKTRAWPRADVDTPLLDERGAAAEEVAIAREERERERKQDFALFDF